MDAFPGYTYFNPTRKVLCAMQIIEDTEAAVSSGVATVFPHEEGEAISESERDSVTGAFIPSADAILLGDKITVGDMISPDTYISNTGKVYGTLHYVKDFEAFSSVEDEQSGTYFPLRLSGKGTRIQVKKNGQINKTVEEWDPNWIIRITDPSATWEFLVDDESVQTLDFSEVTLEKKE